jgi:hypothetical protein
MWCSFKENKRTEEDNKEDREEDKMGTKMRTKLKSKNHLAAILQVPGEVTLRLRLVLEDL